VLGALAAVALLGAGLGVPALLLSVGVGTLVVVVASWRQK